MEIIKSAAYRFWWWGRFLCEWILTVEYVINCEVILHSPASCWLISALSYPHCSWDHQTSLLSGSLLSVRPTAITSMTISKISAPFGPVAVSQRAFSPVRYPDPPLGGGFREKLMETAFEKNTVADAMSSAENKARRAELKLLPCWALILLCIRDQSGWEVVWTFQSRLVMNRNITGKNKLPVHFFQNKNNQIQKLD